MRVVVQSLLEGSPTSLSEKANELNDAAKSSFPSSEAFNLSEPCPACDAPIPLENLLSAVCPQGHVWSTLINMRCHVCTPLMINFSAVLFDLIRALDAYGPHMYRLHPKGLPSPIS